MLAKVSRRSDPMISLLAQSQLVGGGFQC
jgi:hypothetical protein